MAQTSEQAAYQAAGITCRRAAEVTAAAATYATWLNSKGSLEDAKAALFAAARTSKRAARVLLRAAQLYTEISGEATLLSIAVTPSTPTFAHTTTEQFTATGTYDDGLTRDLTTVVAWTSGTTGHMTIGLHTGLATGVAAGTSVITATDGSISGNTTATAS